MPHGIAGSQTDLAQNRVCCAWIHLDRVGRTPEGSDLHHMGPGWDGDKFRNARRTHLRAAVEGDNYRISGDGELAAR